MSTPAAAATPELCNNKRAPPTRAIPKPNITKPGLSKLRQPSTTNKLSPTKTSPPAKPSPTKPAAPSKAQTKAPAPPKTPAQSKSPQKPGNKGGNKAPSKKSPQKPACQAAKPSPGVKAPGPGGIPRRSSAGAKTLNQPSTGLPRPKPPAPDQARSAPQRSKPDTKPKTKPSNRNSGEGPVPPPRSAVGIKRSVTTRKSSAKSIEVPNNGRTLTKHPSLVKQRSISSGISSTSSTDSLACRKQLGSRPLKTRQLALAPEKPISRSSKQQGTKRRQLGSASSRDKSKEKLSHEKCVKYRETAAALQKSRSKESVSRRESEARKRRSSLPSVAISPAQLLLNQTLHDRFSKSVRSGIVLSDSQASLLSFSSDPSLCISNDAGLDSIDGDAALSSQSCISDEIFEISGVDDDIMNLEMPAKSNLTKNLSDLVRDLDDLENKDNGDVEKNVLRDDVDLEDFEIIEKMICVDGVDELGLLQYTQEEPMQATDAGPSSPPADSIPCQLTHEQTTTETHNAFPYDQIDTNSMNDLSPNKTPSFELNIISQGEVPDKQLDEKSINLDSNSSTLTLTQDLEIDIPPKSHLITEEKWNSSSNLTAYNSPDDNCLDEADKDLYYDSSELSIDISASEESINKELNTDRNNMAQSLQDKDLDKNIDLESEFPNTNIEQSSKRTPADNSSSVGHDDVLSPLSPNSDPLGLLDYEEHLDSNHSNVCYDQHLDRPIIILEQNSVIQHETTSAPGSVNLPPKFPHHSNFTRSQRSIRPKKNTPPKLLVRSASLEKRYMTKTLQCSSLDSFHVPEIFIVQDLHSPSPMSARFQSLNSRNTPEILITDDPDMIECYDPLELGADGKAVPHRRLLRRKDRQGVVRRFSETQVLKHHKEKYMNKKEYEHKYNSCPISGDTCSPEKLSGGNIRSMVKRVTSMLNPSLRPRVLVKKHRRSHGGEYGSSSSVYIDFGTESSRSLHDDMPDSPHNLHISAGSLKRSNSLELEDQNLSSIRRTMSDREKQDSDSPDHLTSSKAKSITAHLDRIRMCQHSEDFPPLPYQTWSDFIPTKDLDKKQQEQQHHIWELIMTEHSYLSTVMFVVQNLFSPFRQLQGEGFLAKFDLDHVFLNIEQIQDIHLTFWRECVEPIINNARDLGEPLNPEIITKVGSLFEEELNPYFTYFTKYTESHTYRKLHHTKNADFKEFINWCDTQLRSKFDRLRLEDMLIKPIQRVLQYHLIIKDIYKNTNDDDLKTSLKIFHDKVKRFGDQLNSRKEEKEEEQKIEVIKDRIDGYNVMQTGSGHVNEHINQILSRYTKFDLAARVPVLGSQRKFLHEQQCKLVSATDNKSSDVILFLFSDLLLITKPTKSSKTRKSKITKQPFTLSRVVIEELKDGNNTSLIIYLNEYGSAIDMFLLQSSNSESHTTFLNAIKQAKDNHERELKRYYDETDSSNKSTSSVSINSSTAYLESPLCNRHTACSITRSSSEHYPQTRRNITEPSTSVSRAQSMPASNEKRNLLVEQNTCLAASSSASSSTSGSAASVSGSSSVSGTSDCTTQLDKSVTLSDIKETADKHGQYQDDSDDTTVKCDTGRGKLDNEDFIGNLSTEFRGKLDMKGKNIDDTVITRGPADYDIYKIQHDLEQS